jgi:hypothetical protein
VTEFGADISSFQAGLNVRALASKAMRTKATEEA